MIEVQIDVKRRTVVNWSSGFPEDTDDDEIFRDLMTIWNFNPEIQTQNYIIATAIFLTRYYESQSWRIIATTDQVEVARMEYSMQKREDPPVARVSRYQREPVI